MLDFVKSAFRGFFGVILWINLILVTIFGGIVGNMMGSFFRGGGHPIIGGIIGLICGLFINIVGGGFIATILNIDKNLQYLRNNASKHNTSNDLPTIVGVSGDTWTCKACSTKNPASESACKGCGKYR